jgi:hypothetical protein
MIAPETVRKALDAIKRSADYQYFFSQLKSPDWLQPLWDAGLFRAPPAPTKDGNYISFPLWAESRYLARMGSHAPEIVRDIILKMPETENVRVHEDVIEAALSMPPTVAAKLTDKIRAWLDTRRSPLLPETLGQLISHLARGGQVSEALELARTVLAVFPGDDIVADLPGGTYRSRQDPAARFDTWYYGEILKKYIPDLVSVSGEKSLFFLCDLLDSAVKFRRTNENNDTEDFSYIWRPAVEHHDQNHSFGIVSLLVSAVRDAAEQVARDEPSKISEIVRILETHKWPIFRRIALHLIRIFPDHASSEIRESLTDKERFEEEYHEYALLLQSQFSNLSPDDQKTILSWIEDGPELHAFTKNAKDFTGQEASQEETHRYVRSWQLQRLSPLRNVIHGEWKMRYDDLVKEFGAPTSPDRVPSVVMSWVGPSSPLDSAALGSMSVEALIDFFGNWNPPKDFHSPTPEGLAREFTPIVALDPEKFAEQATRFRNLDPTYVRSLLSGFRDAASQKHVFAWTPVLELCQWVVDQPRDSHGKVSAPLERDPHWGWARKTISELLEQGFTDGPTEILFDLREAAWKILETLTNDPEPTPEYEEKYGGSNMDPAHIAINTTRGEAMHAVIYYGCWVHRNLERQSGKEQMSQGFDRMPEIREVLDAHLRTDPSLGVRSVYGRFFPQLHLLDPIWTQKELFTIFPLGSSLRPFFEAAWNTYILFCNPSDGVINVLEPIYSHAIEQLADRANQQSEISEPERHLAAHVGSYYWSGKLKIDDPNGLLQRFWSNAEPKLRGYLFEYVGRSLASIHGEVPQEIIQRLQRLWEFRLNVVKTAPEPIQYKEELEAFSWCFGSGKFDDLWATDQLKDVLTLVNKIDFPKLVVERLVVLAKTFPRISVECLKLVVESELDAWEIYGWRKEAKSILVTAMQSGDVRAKEAAVELTHRLGAKGHFEFTEILGHQ